jgi:hypothetical protein
MEYKCERCGRAAMLCVSDWGYVGALCDQCLDDSKHFLRLPKGQRTETAPEIRINAAASSARSP